MHKWIRPEFRESKHCRATLIGRHVGVYYQSNTFKFETEARSFKVAKRKLCIYVIAVISDGIVLNKIYKYIPLQNRDKKTLLQDRLLCS